MGEPTGNFSGIPAASGATGVGSLTRRSLSALAAVLLVVGGVTGSVLAASSLAHNDTQKSRQAFEQSSAEVSSTLELAIQNQESLVVNASAFLLDNPDATSSRLVQWLSSVKAYERYPELLGMGHSLIVTPSDLPAIAARILLDPPGPLLEDGVFQVIPPGDRPFYCIVVAGATPPGGPPLPAGFDLCAEPLMAKPILTARDSGVGSFEPIPKYGSTNEFGLRVQVPIYRGGVTPTTVTDRREAFVGWVGILLDTEIIVARALQGHPDTAATLRYHSASSDAEFSNGTAPDGAQSFLIDLHNGWTVETFGAVASSSVWSNGNAAAMLAAGVVLSLLLAALVLVLASGRARALRLVAERTAELHGAQALLVDTARQAGMAEIATNVLHNVGNVLNSVNVSTDLVRQQVRGSKSAGLTKAVKLMQDHADDLGDFLVTDARGRTLPGYLATLAVTLSAERDSIDEELSRLADGVTHIKEIVSAQRSLAGVRSVLEPVRINDLVEDALRMAGIEGLADVTVARDFPDGELLPLDRHRIVLILVNLINNAAQAMEHNGERPRRLGLRIEVTAEKVTVSVTDSGKGISFEDLNKIFVHGFTTRPQGKGFGLHSAALAANEIGGSLTVDSNGIDAGATFTLQLPLVDQLVPA